jgi:hypothetical protein
MIKMSSMEKHFVLTHFQSVGIECRFTVVKGGADMGWRKRILSPMMLVAGMFLTLAGCAGPPVDKTLQAEKLLGTAGFQLKMADTAAKFERINRPPQKQVVRGPAGDREIYVWAAPEIG